MTGPYLDKNGVSVLTGGSGAGSVFLPNRDGRYIGPGHVGYGEGRLTYHFYDGNDNGAPKLRVTTMSFSNGWPVAGGRHAAAVAGSRRRTALTSCAIAPAASISTISVPRRTAPTSRNGRRASIQPALGANYLGRLLEAALP